MKKFSEKQDDLLQTAVNFHNLKDWTQAANLYRKILLTNPNHFDANHLLAAALYEQKDFPSALFYINKAIEIDPKVPFTYNTLGLIISNLGDKKSAIESYKIAIKLKPDYFEALFNLGNLLNDLKEYKLAIRSYDQCLKINNCYIHAYLNRGNAYKELSLYEEAIKNYDDAISIDLKFFDAIYNKGLVLQQIGEHDDALRCYENVLLVNPEHIPARWALSLCQLLLGDLTNGFINYEIRFKNREISSSFTTRDLKSPIWLGDQDIKDKIIFVYHEQGLGDTIQFSRYIETLSNIGAKVIFEVQKPLTKLLSSNNIDTDRVTIISDGDEIPEHDYRCSLLSLPLALKTNLNNIPKRTKYISSPDQYLEKWEKILGKKNKNRIGVVWSGNKDHKNDINRSIPLNIFSDFFLDNCEYYSLQKEVRESDFSLLKSHDQIIHLGDQLTDFMDTAAACDLMDLVITVDTSVAHLSAALGVNTWVLIPFNPDWRWLLNRNESPWYPTIKLFRQQKPGDWTSALTEVKTSLIKYLDKPNLG